MHQNHSDCNKNLTVQTTTVTHTEEYAGSRLWSMCHSIF